MSSYAGSSLVVIWTTSAATTTLTGNHRNFTYTPSMEFIEETAGADTTKKYLASVTDGAASFEAIFEAGTATGGTLTYSTCIIAQVGTLKWMPEGTAGTLPYYSFPGICQGAALAYPYRDVVSVTVNWQQNGTLTAAANT